MRVEGGVGPVELINLQRVALVVGSVLLLMLVAGAIWEAVGTGPF
jgi:hypothetical protein